VVGEADGRGVELEAGRHAERIGLLVELDRPFLPRLELAHDDARQSLGTLEANEVMLEEDDVEDQHARGVRHERDPVLGIGSRDRRRHDLEVLGAVGVGEDVEGAVAFLDVVFAVGEAGRDQARGAALPRVDDAELAGLVVVRVDNDVAAGERFIDADEEARIGLLVDDLVVGLRRAHDVAADAVGTVVIVVLGIVDRRAVGRPDAATGDVLEDFVAVLAGREVAEAQGVELAALAVGAPGEDLVARIVVAAAEAEILHVAGLDVAVEQDFLGAAVARGAGEDGVLLALFHARVVGEGAVLFGQAGLVFLDAAADLSIDLVDERCLRVLEQFLRVGVLGLEIGADVGGECLGLLHHLLPVVGAQPVVRILPGDAVRGGGMLAAFGDGRSGHGEPLCCPPCSRIGRMGRAGRLGRRWARKLWQSDTPCRFRLPG
jgi:hypothetical protein